MDAQEARKLANKSLQGPAIEKFIKRIDHSIESLAKQGRTSIDNLWLSLEYPTDNERKAVELHYTNLGFKWVDHPNPDPGHPCSSEYTTLSW